MTVPPPDGRAQLAGWLATVLRVVRADEAANARPAEPADRAGVPPLAGVRLYREILDRLDESIAAYSADDRYLYGNNAYHRRYPHLPADPELAGKSFQDILRYALEVDAIIDKQAVDDPEAYLARRVRELHRHDGAGSERLNTSGTWDFLRLRRTGAGQSLSIRTDITDQKRVQDDLRLALERLETEGAQRAAFVAKLSHELRTPLTAILGYAEMIENEAIGPVGQARYREYAASISQAGRRLLDLVDRILALSRLEAGRMEMSEAPIDLVDVLRREITVVEPVARQNQTLLALDLPGEFPALLGDARLVRQMVLNLLSNAVRFTQRGTVVVSLRRRQDSGIDLHVADNGIGMTPDVLARAGDPYFRGPIPPSGIEPGTGLGLAVAKELVELHQGRLSIVSEPGRGTTATLSFPADRTIPIARSGPTVRSG